MSTTEDRLPEVYELGYLVLPSIPEDKLPDTVNSIKEIVKKAGGTEIDSESPIKQTLAYQMSKTVGASRYVVNDAYIGWIKFEIDGSKVETIREKVAKLDEILRSLVIKTTRETHFTFAQALAAKNVEEVVGEVEVPALEEVEVPIESVVEVPLADVEEEEVI